MHFLFKRLVLAFVLCTSLSTQAEDIDLFAGSAPVVTELPSVLIILDNTANWNSAFVNEKAGLVSVFNGLPADKFRVGLMMFTESGGTNSGDDGAYVRAAIRQMTTANKTKYAAMIAGLDILADKSNSGKISKAMEEAFLYFSAGRPYAGNQKGKTDYLNNTSGSALDNAVYALPGNAMASKSATAYNNPQVSGTCVRNYIIYISNGPAQDSSADITQATNALSAAGGSTAPIPINPSGSQDNVADEWARFLKKSSLATTVYTIDINKTTSGQGPGWTALLKSVAAVSTGKYFDIASEGTQIVDTLNEVFSEIQAVNSVFASVSLPLSVNTQGTYLNQVFVGMFRPDADAAPRWAGNLKQYKIGRVNNSLDLLDADNASAINSQTGFVTECARSFWTPTIVDTEWTFRPQGGCLRVADSQVSNYPDGNIVEKGAQAYRLRMTSTRNTKTCSASACTALQNFDSTSVTQTALGAASTTERDALINWSVGKDVDDEDVDAATTADRRLSAHGDVVHSRPVAINLGTDAAPQVVAFYGGNDGWLRAINGNRSAAIGSIPAGNEMWAFMPPEFHGKIKRIRDNTVGVSYPYTPPGGQPKPYGMDGPITAFQGLVSGVSKAFVYGTMRRGGRSIYAFDATTSLTAPTTPVLKWRIGCPNAADDTGCTAGLSGLGQTWSALKPMMASNYGSGAKSLQIFGGG
ncbi:MAG: pilus assembly protein PilY, partial [Pseudomonadota bacterium]